MTKPASSKLPSSFAGAAFATAVLLAAAAIITTGTPLSPVSLAHALPSIEICYVDHITPFLTVSAMHARHAVDFYTPQFPKINWTFRIIGEHGNAVPKDAVRALVQRGASCHVLIGPSWSFYSVALSPIVDTAWVSSAASSVELTDKTRHPFFSRVIPSDDFIGGAMARTAVHFGWKLANVMCSNEPYGRSVTNKFIEHFKHLGGSIDRSRCFEFDDNITRVDSMIDFLAASRTRLIAVGVITETIAFFNFVQRLKERKLDKHFILIFSESACVGEPTFRQLEGALCVTFQVNGTRAAPFHNSYVNRGATEKSKDDAMLRSIGAVYDHTPQMNNTHVFAYLAHDAVKHVMQSLHTHIVNNASLFNKNAVPDARERIRILRTAPPSEGVTGDVRLNPGTGNRAPVDMVLINVQPSQQEVDVGLITLDGVTLHQGKGHPLYWQAARFSSEVPSEMVATSSSDNTDRTTWLLVGLIVSVGAVIISCLVIYYYYSTGTSVKFAPRGKGGGAIAFIFTDVQRSTELWEQHEDDMSAAIQLHNKIIREKIREYECYEVKIIGDSFFIACPTLLDATMLSVSIQRKLQNETTWPAAICDNTKKERKDPHLWSGLMVRIGIHCGTRVEARLDSIHRRYDYFGPTVNIAARISSLACGGQILMTQNSVEQLRSDADYEILLGTDIRAIAFAEHVALRGIKTAQNLVAVFPKELANRHFDISAPARLFEDSSTGAGTGSSSAGSAALFPDSSIVSESEDEDYRGEKWAHVVSASSQPSSSSNAQQQQDKSHNCQAHPLAAPTNGECDDDERTEVCPDLGEQLPTPNHARGGDRDEFLTEDLPASENLSEACTMAVSTRNSAAFIVENVLASLPTTTKREEFLDMWCASNDVRFPQHTTYSRKLRRLAYALQLQLEQQNAK